MSEYLIQSETLDDIADAINAKTGGSSAMTPTEMVTAIENISSGGVKSVEGTFTLASDSSFPTITHNLGTVKIAGFVIPHYQIVAHSGYKNYLAYFINWTAFIPDGETWVKDFTPYNSTKFPDPITVNDSTIRSLARDTGLSSPWTTQGNQWSGTYYPGLVCTDTTVRVGTGTTWASGTYYYKIFALE